LKTERKYYVDKGMQIMEPTAAGPSIIRVILRDGQSLKVRPITRDDKEKLKDLFYRLSPQTRYLRFGARGYLLRNSTFVKEINEFIR